jgi:hypothetical protein
VNREQFVHVLQAAAAIAEDELVIVGSQAVLASIDEPPDAMMRSIEIDVYPRTEPGRAIELDRNIGEGSRFHEMYGYYAHGVGPETITAPAGWEQRLVRFEVAPIQRRDRNAVGWCLSLPDLMLAKLAARRPHDLTFVEAALRARVVSADELRRGIDLMPERVRDATSELLEGLAAKLSRSG